MTFERGIKMRLDKYLKVSRLIKRRTIANEACDAQRVKVNGKVARASFEINIGDIIELSLGGHMLKAEVLNVTEHVNKDGASSLFNIIEQS
jgi:ribosomal 50S subunit-recycling heat shock protein